MSKPKEDVVAKLTPELELRGVKNAIPMVGWHAPNGTFEVDGETWQIAIAGGCKQLVITPPREKRSRETDYYAIDLGEVAWAMVEQIKNIRKDEK